MSRRLLIVGTMCAFYLLQLGLLGYTLVVFRASIGVIHIVAALALALALGAIDFIAARYLMRSLDRAQMSYALEMSERLHASLERYQATLEESAQETQELGRAIERELEEARAALMEGSAVGLDEHLQEGLDLASEARRPICDNAAVAAILDAKVRQCRAAGVDLQASVDLPEDLPIPDVELAAVFFNLIDNALAECERLAETAPGNALTIDVRALTQAGQLVVTATNPCRTGTDVRARAAERKATTGGSHGLGTEVVRTIASSHGGIAELGEKQGVFTASLMIPLR